MSSKEMKDKILESINKLPENSLKEIMDFVDFIQSKSVELDKVENNNPESSEQLDPSKDPLLKYIGSIEHGSLAQDIDKELYGEMY